jgi:5-methyltetrahydrofolate--homocysteine methyltransferase
MEKPAFKEIIREKILVFDGAMGTTIMRAGVDLTGGFEALNFTHSELITSIHQGYVEAGANLIETNTFGGNRLKLQEYGAGSRVREINAQAVLLARKAIRQAQENGAGTQPVWVVGSMGPLGALLQPMGALSFDEAYAIFAEQAQALKEGGAEIICIETISDLQEIRAALLAVKENTELPVICSLTYDESHKTVTGTSVAAAVYLLERLRADVIAANCSTGPEQMVELSAQLVKYATVPVSVMPNAGQPELKDGQAVYKMSPEKFAASIEKILQNGVRLVGGCCGTTREHIAAVRALVDKKFSPPAWQGAACQGKFKPAVWPGIKFSSRTEVAVIDQPPVIVGEKINPTGRKIFQEELKAGNFTRVRADAKNQAEAGAHLLEVNMGVPLANEVELMARATFIVQNAVSLPLSLDSPNAEALAAALKNFVGIPLVNSVNGEEKSLQSILPQVKRFGAKFIALTLDEAGVPETVAGKMAVAEKIVSRAQKLGIPAEDIFVDCLTMTVGVGVAAALATLEAIAQVKKKFGVHTILGISNVSHGMPEREKLNAYYLMLALLSGLDAAIVDPTAAETKKVIAGFRRAQKEDWPKLKEKYHKQFVELAEQWKTMYKKVKKAPDAALKLKQKISGGEVARAVEEGDGDAVKFAVAQLLAQGKYPQKIIEDGLIKGMERVGKWFSSGKYFLPQVVASAEAMQIGFALCKEKIPAEKFKGAGTIIIATVKGDVHDIGKNIVKMMLENHGFEVVDLGKDVPKETIIEAAVKYKASAIALSALLTTTMAQMGEVAQALKQQGLTIPIIVGGAVVNQSYADKIGANFGRDALASVNLARQIVKKLK